MNIAFAAFLAFAVGAVDARNFRLKMPVQSDVKQSSGGSKSMKRAGAGALGTDSVSGTYALVLRLGVNDALGLMANTYNDDGSITGDSFLNLPNPEDPARVIVPFDITGNLDGLEADGQGEQTLILTQGAVAIEPTSLQVTEREGSSVLSLQGAFDVPATPIPAAMVQFEMTSRADGGFTVSSLSGLYTLRCISGQFVGFRSGTVTFDGEGGFSGLLRQNDVDPTTDPEDPIGARKITEVDLTGTYTVEDNGFATISFEGIGSSLFLVTTNEGEFATTLTGGFAVAAPENGGLIRCDLDSLE